MLFSVLLKRLFDRSQLFLSSLEALLQLCDVFPEVIFFIRGFAGRGPLSGRSF
jgi:hypothetical protein